MPRANGLGENAALTREPYVKSSNAIALRILCPPSSCINVVDALLLSISQLLLRQAGYLYIVRLLRAGSLAGHHFWPGFAPSYHLLGSIAVSG